MLLIETNSIGNMGCQKIKVVRFLRYSSYLTNTWCVCQVTIFRFIVASKIKKVFSLNKIGMLLFETWKTKNLIFWIVTRVSAQNYTVDIENLISPSEFLSTHWQAINRCPCVYWRLLSSGYREVQTSSCRGFNQLTCYSVRLSMSESS